MILKETILSAFTERGTLLKWLKKVEAALNNAVLTDISVVQVSATQVKFKLTFENGDFVESPIITLPRGEKGATGPAGPAGKDGLDGQGIAATIEVGTVTTGAAGTSASVTNVGTEKRAVLNFAIPRGDRGEEGSAGIGFDSASELSINDGEVNIIAGDNGVNIEASFEVAVGEEILEIPSTMYLPFKGSESIVIDVDESGEFIDIHLDADIAAKLGRALVTPMSAPSALSLVGVDTSNAQIMLKIGDGLVVENGVLKLAQPLSPTTIKAGTYRFNDSIDYTADLEANINFTLPGVSIPNVTNLIGTKIAVSWDEQLDQGSVVIIYTASYDDETQLLPVYTTNKQWNALNIVSSGAFPEGAGKIITVIANTEVDEAFINWFKSVTTEVT